MKRTHGYYYYYKRYSMAFEGIVDNFMVPDRVSCTSEDNDA